MGLLAIESDIFLLKTHKMNKHLTIKTSLYSALVWGKSRGVGDKVINLEEIVIAM